LIIRKIIDIIATRQRRGEEGRGRRGEEGTGIKGKGEEEDFLAFPQFQIITSAC